MPYHLATPHQTVDALIHTEHEALTAGRELGVFCSDLTPLSIVDCLSDTAVALEFDEPAVGWALALCPVGWALAL